MGNFQLERVEPLARFFEWPGRQALVLNRSNYSPLPKRAMMTIIATCMMPWLATTRT